MVKYHVLSNILCYLISPPKNYKILSALTNKTYCATRRLDSIAYRSQLFFFTSRTQ